jgi:hypothetical protein
VVGQPFAGKSTIIRILADSLSDLFEQGLMGENKT